jgi:hypothetical protein
MLQPKYTSIFMSCGNYCMQHYRVREARNATTGLVVCQCQTVTVTLTRPENNKAKHHELRQGTVMKGSFDHVGCSNHF